MMQSEKVTLKVEGAREFFRATVKMSGVTAVSLFATKCMRETAFKHVVSLTWDAAVKCSLRGMSWDKALDFTSPRVLEFERTSDEGRLERRTRTIEWFDCDNSAWEMVTITDRFAIGSPLIVEVYCDTHTVCHYRFDLIP